MDSWDRIFRSFFNIPNGPSRRSDNWDSDDHGPHDFDDDHDFDDHDHDFPDPFHHFGNFTFRFTEADEMFRHFEEMFKDLGMAEFPPPSRGEFGFLDRPEDRLSPRDRMLKDRSDSTTVPRLPEKPIALRPPEKPIAPRLPEKPIAPRPPEKLTPPQIPERESIFGHLWKSPKWDRIRPQDKVDTEIDGSDESVLDEIVRGSDAESGLMPRMEPRVEQPRFHADFHQSVSVRTIRRPDGSTEHVRTVRGSDGREETTVTRSRGDQSHTVTTRRTPDGEERNESFTNMDQGDVGKFESQWHGESDLRNPTQLGPRIEHRDEETNSIFKSLFGFSLPGFGKT